MIQLPDNWQDYLQVSPQANALFLHLINANNQFFTYYAKLDPAIPLPKALELLTPKLTESAIMAKAYIIEPDMSKIDTEPNDQNWGPAPVVGLDVISLKQYQAMKQIPSVEAPKTAPIPGPEGLPQPE